MSKTPPVEATILIVAWRLVHELEECLDAVAASIEAPGFEVIVVLNGASPDTTAVAESHPIVTKVVTRRANIGFGGACNLGAAHATGKHLIFLNDDTRVDKLWLKTIVASANASDRRGAVASLLLNYDGTVQEAGARILSHGGTLRFGMDLSLADARSGGLLKARAIDYGSAAALLVRRAIFEQLGGFDELFAPAYFEDVDLQLRLREAGFDIWFEPEAKVLHLSGRSTQEDHWFRQFAANRSGHRFIERWAPVLNTAASENDPISALCDVTRRSRPPAHALEGSDAPDDSPMVSLRISHDYEAWLIRQLEQVREMNVEVFTDPNAPSRRELQELVRRLAIRLDELERRGPLGIIKMRIGVRRRQMRQSKAVRELPPSGPASS